MIQAFVKKGSFQDSVSLMLISKKLSASSEIDEVSIMMGTPANKSLLKETGFWHDIFTDVTPNDICVGIKVHNSNDVTALISQQLEESLAEIAKGQAQGPRLIKARSFQSAINKLPDSNMVLVSIAGEYAGKLADQALEFGKNVMLFSDNVSIEDEIALKTKARDKGLIVMGPDCGTSMIAGSPLAFANVLPKDNIGIVGASGTGIQEIASQIALLGAGITNAIGLGGRDLSLQVGGISALTALDMLDCDPDTKVIGFVSKPPAVEVQQKILTKMQQLTKPVVALFLGAKHDKPCDGNVYLANTMDEAAKLCVQLSKSAKLSAEHTIVSGSKILGLYAGGTLAAESAMLLGQYLGLPADSKHDKGVMLDADGHKVIDLGDDFYTVGRPHPMIDPTVRGQQIIDLVNKPEIVVLMADVVLGFGSHSDPAGAFVDAVQELKLKRKDPINVLVTVTGTDLDPQNRTNQIQKLLDAGIIVLDNLPQAVILAQQLIRNTTAVNSKEAPYLLKEVKVINAGLRSFAEDLQATKTAVVHYQWAPVAGGNQRLAEILQKLI